MTLVISLRGFVLLAGLHALPRGRAAGCAQDGSVIVMDRNSGSNAAFYGRYSVEHSTTSADGRPVFRKVGNGRPAYLFYLASESMWGVSRTLWKPPFLIAAVSSARSPTAVGAHWLQFHRGGLISAAAPHIVVACAPQQQCGVLLLSGLMHTDPSQRCTGLYHRTSRDFQERPTYRNAQNFFLFYGQHRWVVGNTAPNLDALVGSTGSPTEADYCIIADSEAKSPLDVAQGHWQVLRHEDDGSMLYEPTPAVRVRCAGTTSTVQLVPLAVTAPKHVVNAACSSGAFTLNPNYGARSGSDNPAYSDAMQCTGSFIIDGSAVRGGRHVFQKVDSAFAGGTPPIYDSCFIFWRQADARWIASPKLDGQPLLSAQSHATWPVSIPPQRWRMQYDGGVARKIWLATVCLTVAEREAAVHGVTRAPVPTMAPYRETGRHTLTPTPHPSTTNSPDLLPRKPDWCKLQYGDYVKCLKAHGCCQTDRCILFGQCTQPTPAPTNTPAPTPHPVAAMVATTVFLSGVPVATLSGSGKERLALAIAQSANVPPATVMVDDARPFTQRLGSVPGLSWTVHGSSVQVQIKAYETVGFFAGCPSQIAHCVSVSTITGILAQPTFGSSLAVFLRDRGFQLRARDVHLTQPVVGPGMRKMESSRQNAFQPIPVGVSPSSSKASSSTPKQMHNTLTLNTLAYIVAAIANIMGIYIVSRKRCCSQVQHNVVHVNEHTRSGDQEWSSTSNGYQ